MKQNSTFEIIFYTKLAIASGEILLVHTRYRYTFISIPICNPHLYSNMSFVIIVIISRISVSLFIFFFLFYIAQCWFQAVLYDGFVKLNRYRKKRSRDRYVMTDMIWEYWQTRNAEIWCRPICSEMNRSIWNDLWCAVVQRLCFRSTIEAQWIDFLAQSWIPTVT